MLEAACHRSGGVSPRTSGINRRNFRAKLRKHTSLFPNGPGR